MGQSDGYGLVLADVGGGGGGMSPVAPSTVYSYSVVSTQNLTSYSRRPSSYSRLTDRETTSPSVNPAWARAASFAPCSPMSAPEGAPPEGAEPRLSCWDFTTAPVRASMSYSYSLPLA